MGGIGGWSLVVGEGWNEINAGVAGLQGEVDDFAAIVATPKILPHFKVRD